MNQKAPDHKVVIVGDSGVGKTCVINRYYYGSFTENGSPTVGTAYVRCKVDLESGPVYLCLWDTAGQEKYANLVPIYVRDSNCVIICFDLTRENSLQTVQRYRSMLNEALPSEVPIVICGNKLDLCEDQTAGREVHQWAMQNNMSSFSISAKTGQGIDDMFQEIANLSNRKAAEVNRVNLAIRKQREREENPSSCGC